MMMMMMLMILMMMMMMMLMMKVVMLFLMIWMILYQLSLLINDYFVQIGLVQLLYSSQTWLSSLTEGWTISILLNMSTTLISFLSLILHKVT